NSPRRGKSFPKIPRHSPSANIVSTNLSTTGQRRTCCSLLMLLCLGLMSCGADPAATALPAPQPRDFLLHLPGIGGHMRIDDSLIAGLSDGGVDAEIQIYDWTGPDRGLISLGSTTRHASESAKVAEMITSIARADPRRKIILTAHSGGAAIAVWALEKLPDDV